MITDIFLTFFLINPSYWHEKEILCCLIKYLQILNNLPFILIFRSALTLICSYSEENKAYFWNSNLGLPEEEICLQVSRNVMVAQSSHFYFMICDKIQINQSKIFFILDGAF